MRPGCLIVLLRLSYILNRGWIDHSEHRLPTYKEITGNKKGKSKAPAVNFDLDDDDSSDDTSAEEEQSGAEATGSLDEDDFDEITDRFESSYNFRFEEPYVPHSSLRLRESADADLHSYTEEPRRSRDTRATLHHSSVEKTRLERRLARSARHVRRRSCCASGRRSSASRR